MPPPPAAITSILSWMTFDLLDVPAEQRTTLHGEREMDWSHWVVQGGEDVGQRSNGLNFSDGFKLFYPPIQPAAGLAKAVRAPVGRPVAAADLRDRNRPRTAGR